MFDPCSCLQIPGWRNPDGSRNTVTRFLGTSPAWSTMGDILYVANMASLPADSNLTRLAMSRDFGLTWTPVRAIGLPNFPVYKILAHPKDTKTIFVGNLVGVYVSYDEGDTFSVLGDSLPHTAVYDLYIAPNRPRIVIAALNGGGAWQLRANHK